jgi:FixJ family two-component response regulator
VSVSATIAIIEDDDSVRAAIVSLVRSLGFVATSFASAEAFFGSATLGRTDCIVTDVQMPGMSGLELQSHLAAQGDRTPVIFITAFPEERVRRQAIAAGAIGFLAKPFDGDAMSACIERALKASGLSASS